MYSMFNHHDTATNIIKYQKIQKVIVKLNSETIVNLDQKSNCKYNFSSSVHKWLNIFL